MIKFKSIKEISEFLEEFSPESKLFDGFENAIVGVMETKDGLVFVYDKDKVIESFIKDGMTLEEAEENFDFNVLRTLPYMGDLAPVFLLGIKK